MSKKPELYHGPHPWWIRGLIGFGQLLEQAAFNRERINEDSLANLDRGIVDLVRHRNDIAVLSGLDGSIRISRDDGGRVRDGIDTGSAAHSES